MLKFSAAINTLGESFSSTVFSLKWLIKPDKKEEDGIREEFIKTNCGSCKCGCRVIVQVRDGRVIKIEGEPETHTDGAICPRGMASTQILYSPERLNYPMKRTRPKGDPDPGWMRISWEEAYSTIIQKFLEYKEKYGLGSIVHGTGTNYQSGCHPWNDRLQYAFGTPNKITPGIVCNRPARIAWRHVIDIRADKQLPPDVANSKCIVLWAANPVYAGEFCRVEVSKAFARGAKIIVVDPRMGHPFAHKADIWLAPRPGTDGALMFGWLNVMINEGLYDKEFVENWTNSPFLVVTDPKKPLYGRGEDPGPLLTEIDVNPQGKPTRYMVWDEVTQSLKYWDTTPVSSQGKEPYNRVLEWESPGVKPALFGTYRVKLASGVDVECKTVLQLFAERAAEFTPERTEEITWVPAEKLRQAVRMYMANMPACHVPTVQTQITTNCYRTAMLDATIAALSGRIEKKGGNVFLNSPPIGPAPDAMLGLGIGAPRLPNAYKGLGAPNAMYPGRTLGQEKYPLIHDGDLAPPDVGIWTAIETRKPYPIKMLWGFAQNPLSWAPNVKRTFELLKKIEFTVTADYFTTPFTEICDMVLPAACWLERDLCNLRNSGPNRVYASLGAVKPLFARRDDKIMIFDLGKRLVPEYFPWESIEGIFDTQLRNYGVSWEEFKKIGVAKAEQVYEKHKKGMLRRDKRPGFETPTGKVEIYSTVHKEIGSDPLPYYEEPASSPVSQPDLAKEYPLILTSGARHTAFQHSHYRQIPWLRELRPDNILEINPATAAELGISNRDMVFVESPKGKIKVRALLTEGIHPKVVHTYHGWYFPSKPFTHKFNLALDWMEQNVNVLADEEHKDPDIGAYGLRAYLVKVYKAD